LTSEGTLTQLSCLGAHAQNGVVERKHCHVIKSARTLLISSFVPSHFWGEAVPTAVYLINRQLSSKLSGKIPSEVLFGTPRYDHLRMFGCTCYVLFPPCERTKLLVQSIEFVFLGYSPEHKGYRCYDPSTRRIRISRDVSFNENRPFFHNRSTHTSYFLVESTSFICLPSFHDSSTPPSSISAPDVHIPITPPSISTSPSPYSSKPPVIQTYIRRSCPITTTSPDTYPDEDSCTNNTESCNVFNQGYRLRDRGTIEPLDRYGFPLAGVAIIEPSSYREASAIPQWQLAMIEELSTLDRTGTWDIVPLPSHVVPITCKWVFKVKTKYDGSIER
jgi:hypothetical protein